MSSIIETYYPEHHNRVWSDIPEIADKIKEIAKSKPDIETCGLIVNGKVFECRNSALEADKTFSINVFDYLNVAKNGKPQAIFHSHINNNETASIVDKNTSAIHNLPIITYNINNDSFDEYNQNIGTNYVGRKFKLGQNDCFTLLRDYYLNELAIKIPNLSETYKYSSKSNAFYDHEVFGLTEVKEKKIHDILISKNGDANHILIYLGGNRVLHQPMNVDSLIQEIDENLEFKITKILRHGSLISKNSEPLS